MMNDFVKGIIDNRYVLHSLISKDLMSKYRRSKLGVLWSILTPLGLALIVGSVYAILFGQELRAFIPILFASLNPWLFMSGTADNSTASFTCAEGYIKQSTVASQIFPIRTTTVNFVTLLYSILTFYCIYLFLEPEKFNPVMLMSIPGIFIMYVFTLGISYITSIITLYVRDYPPLQSLVFQGLFYVTPIIYPASILEKRGYSIVYKLNPFYYMLEIVRTPMLGDKIPDIFTYIIAIVLAILSISVGIFLMMKNKNLIAFKL